jgi:pseudoazurin
MNIRVSNLAIIFVVIALAACSSDDKSQGNDTKSSAVAPVTTSQDDSAMQSAESATSTVATGPAEAPAPIQEAATEPAPAPEPMVAKPEPEPEPTEPMPSAAPTQHIVKGVVTQWAPMVLFVKPGDQVVFRQMAGHDTETIEGMIPEGAETWKSKLGAEGFAVSPSVPGIYMYKCNPHVSLGMIGAIAVGDPPYANLAAIEAHPQNKGMIGRAIRKLKQALDNREGT